MKHCLTSSNPWSTAFDCSGKEQRLKSLNQAIAQKDFWQKENAVQIQQELAELSKLLSLIAKLKKELTDSKELVSIISDDSTEASQIIEQVNRLEKEIAKQSLLLLLNGKYDNHFAILTIKSGAGGRDAEDWAALLLKMYQAYFQKQGWLFKTISQNFGEAGGPEGRIGLKEAVLRVKGEWAYGLLKKESGIHRLVRLSPFSAKSLRHTSFASVEIAPELAQKEQSQLKINPDDLQIDMFRSSGPGGQNVNKRETAVRITHLPTGLIVACQVERSQGANRKIAMDILLAKLIVLEEKKQAEEVAKAGPKRVSADFGHQIRSYVLHPYKLVKDHRTDVETSNVEAVLAGDLSDFIEAELRLSRIG